MKMKSFKNALLVLSPIAMMLAGGVAAAQPFALNDICADWPNGPKPRPKFSVITKSADGKTSYAQTGLFPPSVKVAPTPVPGHDVATEGGALYPEFDTELERDNPLNLLPTVYENARNCMGQEIPNTLASTPERPYNLHLEEDGASGVFHPTAINATSPTNDLDEVRRMLNDAIAQQKKIDMALVQRGIDILEGNPVPDRVYSGFPVLHYNGPNKLKSVDPVTRTVEINQIWFDTHIESDTSYIDTSAVEKTPEGAWDNEEWYIKYNVYVLNRGHEDFAPFPMLYEDPAAIEAMTGRPAFMPNISIDQTFFPMEEGLLYTFTIKQAPARYYNLTYHWGWRIHPPRVQATENVLRGFNVPDPNNPGQTMAVPRNFFEIQVFGENPEGSEEAKLAAISMIGDLSPAKRMWSALQALKDGEEKLPKKEKKGDAFWVSEFEESFFDWGDRTKLPRGVAQDPDADVTLLYVNNTIYGNIKGRVRDAQVELPQWKQRGDTIHVALKNADYYPHQYTLVDFGGMRGWENQFHNTIDIGGAGPWFTFGRIHWWPHTVQPPNGAPQIVVGPAARPATLAAAGYGLDSFTKVDKGENMVVAKGKKQDINVLGHEMPTEILGTAVDAGDLGRHDVHWTFNYEPSQRLRMYQFDAFHHDVAVWSIH